MDKQLVISLTVVIVLAVRVGAEVGRECKMSEECDNGECCMRRSLFEGNRQTTPTCQSLGHIGEKCYPGENYHKWVAFLGACPCLSGVCRSSTVKEFPDSRFVGKCITSSEIQISVTNDAENSKPEHDGHVGASQSQVPINRFQTSFSEKAKTIRKIIQVSRVFSEFPKKWSAMRNKNGHYVY